MEDEITIRVGQLEELGAANGKLISALDASKDPEVDIKTIKGKLHEYSEALEAFKMEIRQDRNKYQAQSKQFSDTLKQQKAELALIEAGVAKANLLEGANDQTEEGLIERGLKTMEDSTEHLLNTVKMVEDAKGNGTDILAKTALQQEQLDRIDENLRTTNSSLARSKRTIGRISRKVVTDKYLWVLAFGILALIVALIVWKSLAPSAANSAVQIPGSMQMKQAP